MTAQPTYIVAITGASGAIYGLRLLRALLARPVRVYWMVSEAGRLVVRHETGLDPMAGEAFFAAADIRPHADARWTQVLDTDLFAAPASGSFRHEGMVVAPCSMKTLAGIATGLADRLIHRSADVCLKEGRRLILLPRETPLSQIHLENMLAARRAGAIILPPCPGFYSRPKTIEALVDTVVARTLDHLAIDHDIAPRWGQDEPA